MVCMCIRERWCACVYARVHVYQGEMVCMCIGVMHVCLFLCTCASSHAPRSAKYGRGGGVVCLSYLHVCMCLCYVHV